MLNRRSPVVPCAECIAPFLKALSAVRDDVSAVFFFFASHIVEISPLSCDPATISHLGNCSRVHFLVLNAFFPLGKAHL